jgi:hypothetical protein
MKKLLLPLFLFGLLLNACKKDDSNTKPSESPMAKILEDKTWVATSAIAGPFELGHIFSTITKGKITQLGCQMPEPGIYTVSLWDANSKKLLGQKSVEQTAANKLTLASLTEIIIEKDVKYIVSVNSAVNGVTKPYNYADNSSATIFPFTIGSVIFQGTVYNISKVTVFPETFKSKRIFGYPDFTFIPD